jgi:3,4-dihydroxy 2-butanone 4-phosphate synthase/GTP cyclohydrolase II
MVGSGEMSRSGLARAAGLHPNSLRRLGESDWNPTADTLLKLERFLSNGGASGVMASAEQIIDEARNGRMFILVDDEDRENEGDLVIPAQMATPQAINFMARHGRGPDLPGFVQGAGGPARARADEPRQRHAPRNRLHHSIEAREGVTTGISAADRARTISVAIDASKGREDIVTPGHVFPLDGAGRRRAGPRRPYRGGGGRVAAGGLNPSGVICEILREDGTMARLDDLIPFAQLHGLKIGTIRDLIAYRLREDRLIEQTAEARFDSCWGGGWSAKSFFNKAGGQEHVALVKGRSTRAAGAGADARARTWSATCSASALAAAGFSPVRCGRSGSMARAWSW